MRIPIAYNLRNLAVRKTTTAMTALGIALTAAVLMAVMALMEGLSSAFQASGHPLHVLALRKAAEAELVSNFTRTAYQTLKTKPGIARTSRGEPMASLEIVMVINLPRIDNPEGMNVSVRGLAPIGVQMREDIRIAAGRWFQTGRREIVVGRGVAARFPDAALGKRLRLGQGDWEVVGIMDAGRSAANSEIFADLNQVSADFSRVETMSSTLVRAEDPVAVQALINDINDDRRLNSEARTEAQYYELQTVSGRPVQYVGTMVAIIMAIGSCFAAMNTMYAAVARRAREIGTLRVLGFSQVSILASFLVESLLLAGAGGLLACLMVLPLNGVTTGLGNFRTFAEIAFDYRVSPSIVATGLGFALAMGAIGGLLPARLAARKQILDALRE